jgi:3-methylcrotonyl-CoA carboxylase beta subunit
VPTIKTRLDRESPAFQSNAAHHRALVDELRVEVARTSEGGGAQAQQKHSARGKLLPRDRVRALLDPGTPFLELSQLAAHGMYDGDAPSAGIITGIGRVEGREVVIVANDATVKGGTYYPMTVKKHLRAQEIAAQNRLPCVYLVDSGGAFLPLQDEVFPDKEHFGRIFYNQANLSARACADRRGHGLVHRGRRLRARHVRRVDHREEPGTIFLGGPPLVKAATGEVVTAEELGGGDVHSRTSGVTDHLADDDRHALAIAREIVGTASSGTPHPGSPVTRGRGQCIGSRSPSTPRRPLRASSPGPAPAVRRREVIARLVDGSEFHEFKALYGTTLVTGFAHLHGMPIGIVANNGILFSESALKGAHFIELCAQRGTPLVFLQNITGFMVGSKYEKGGIAKDGAKMVTAVSCARVPKLTVIIGGSFGAGNYGMCGRAFNPRFLWTWPNARISVMGGEQAASVLATVKRDGIEAKKGEWSKEEERSSRRRFASSTSARAIPSTPPRASGTTA